MPDTPGQSGLRCPGQQSVLQILPSLLYFCLCFYSCLLYHTLRLASLCLVVEHSLTTVYFTFFFVSSLLSREDSALWSMLLILLHSIFVFASTFFPHNSDTVKSSTVEHFQCSEVSGAMKSEEVRMDQSGGLTKG